MDEQAAVTIQLQPIVQKEFLTLDDLSGQNMQNVLSLLGLNTNYKRKQLKISKPPIFYINPIANITLLYNSIYLLFFYMIQIHVSLTMAFGPDFLSNDISDQAFNIYYWTMVIFFVADIFVTFNKGYYDIQTALIVDDFVIIAKKYMSFQLWVDIVCVAVLCLPQFQQQKFHEFISLVPLIFIWIKKFKHQQQIMRIIQYHRGRRNFFTFFILACDILIIGHFGACIYIRMSVLILQSQYYGPDKKYYWLETNDPFNFTELREHWYYIYVYAQSASTGVLSTLVPGPSPKNPITVIFTIGLTLFFVLLTPYVAQILIEILETESQKRLEYENKIRLFYNYMFLKNVPSKLKSKINNFLQILWALQEQANIKQDKKLIDLLPLPLKQQLLVEISFINKMKFFQTFRDQKILRYQLSMKIKRVVFDEKTSIFKRNNPILSQKGQNSFTIDSVYFLASGMVKYSIDLSDSTPLTGFKKVKKIKKQKQIQNENEKINIHKRQHMISLLNLDKFIGLYEFITNQGCFYDCTALDLCEIDKISDKQFKIALKKTGNQQHYHKLKNDILIQSKLNLINRICSICLSQTHIQANCPEISLSKRYFADLLAEQNNIGRSQNRNENFKRANTQGKQKNVKSSKIDHKLILLAGQNRVQMLKQVVIQHIMSSKRVKLDQNIKNLTKSRDFQTITMWKDFYPQFNLDTK